MKARIRKIVREQVGRARTITDMIDPSESPRLIHYRRGRSPTTICGKAITTSWVEASFDPNIRTCPICDSRLEAEMSVI